MIDLRKCKFKISSKELKAGIKVEMEHTNSRKLAERIARQHYCENKKYYKILKKAGL